MLFHLVSYCHNKEVAITHITVCYSLSSFVTVLIDRLLFDLSICNASFYSVPNDDQWNACAVSWINKPLNMLVTALASVTCCSAVTQYCSVMLPNACSSGELLKNRQVWQLGMFFYKPFQQLASAPHLHGEISYCAFTVNHCSAKIGNQTRNRLTECNL